MKRVQHIPMKKFIFRRSTDPGGHASCPLLPIQRAGKVKTLSNEHQIDYYELVLCYAETIIFTPYLVQYSLKVYITNFIGNLMNLTINPFLEHFQTRN